MSLFVQLWYSVADKADYCAHYKYSSTYLTFKSA